jgi:hypothetical protein
MFQSDKIYNEASNYVKYYENYDVTCSYEYYYIAQKYIEDNFYKNLKICNDYYYNYIIKLYWNFTFKIKNDIDYTNYLS